MLDRCGIERAADLFQRLLARGAVVVEDANLDQLVCQQIDIDLVHHRPRQAVLADDDDGIEVVRLGAQRAALGWAQGCHAAILTRAEALVMAANAL
jgi:hypothetical protein